LFQNGADVKDANRVGYTPLLLVIGILGERISAISFNKRTPKDKLPHEKNDATE